MTIPWGRRFLLARRPEIAKGVLHVALCAIFGWYRERGREHGAPDGQTGAVSATQRFGSAANLNLHFHILLLDGVYFRDPKTGVLLFHPAPAPSQEEIEVLVSLVAERVERWLKRKGFGRDEEDVPVEEDEDDAQVLLMAASMEGRSALGRRSGRKTRRMGVPRGPSELPPRCAAINGYNLHADVCVSAKDRIGLERLCRYLLRPALSKTRLEEKEDGTIVLRLKRPWSDGTTEIVLSRLEFLERICALIPPPKSHTVAYHGILAGNAAWRSEVVPRDPPRPRPTKAVFKLIRVEDSCGAPSRSQGGGPGQISWKEYLEAKVSRAPCAGNE